MNEADKKEIKAAVTKLAIQLLLALGVVLGAIDYALVAPYLREIAERSNANGAMLAAGCL